MIMKRYEIKPSITEDAKCIYVLWENYPISMQMLGAPSSAKRASGTKEQLEACIEHLGGNTDLAQKDSTQ